MELRRIVGLVLAVVVLAAFASLPVLAADETHEGKFIRVDGNKLFMSDKDGNEHSHALAPDVKITLDGKDAKKTDLKAGMSLKVTVKDAKEATKIEAKSAN
jgi:hypothetical protein